MGSFVTCSACEMLLATSNWDGLGMWHRGGVEECVQRFDWETWRKQANWKTQKQMVRY